MLNNLVTLSFWKDITYSDRIACTFVKLIEPLNDLLPKVLDQLDSRKMTENFTQTLFESFKLLKDIVPKVVSANKPSFSKIPMPNKIQQLN